MLSSGVVLLVIGIPLFVNVLLLPRAEVPHFVVPAMVYFVMVFTGILLVYRSLVFTRHPDISAIGKRIEILIREPGNSALGNSRRIVGRIRKEIADVQGTKRWIISLRPRKGRPSYVAISYVGETVSKGILGRMPRVVVEIEALKGSSFMEKEILDSEALEHVAVGEIVVISDW
jgi:hypothetical protein